MENKKLSQNVIDAIKIVLGILEGFDTFDYIIEYTKLPEQRAKYLLRLLKDAGVIYKTEGRKKWRVRVNYYRVWKKSEYIVYNELDQVIREDETIKALKELEQKLTRRL
jgi:hypothetical protein